MCGSRKNRQVAAVEEGLHTNRNLSKTMEMAFKCFEIPATNDAEEVCDYLIENDKLTPKEVKQLKEIKNI